MPELYLIIHSRTAQALKLGCYATIAAGLNDYAENDHEPINSGPQRITI